jgi:hypothetical protein
VTPACTSKNPTCLPMSGSRWGWCSGGTQADAGPGSVTCDPVARTGCTRTEDACYAFAGGSEFACLLFGDRSLFSGCEVHSECPAGAGCFDGPNGRLCRPYCRLQGPACPANAPACMMIGRSDYGACAATVPPPDAGVLEVAPI